MSCWVVLTVGMNPLPCFVEAYRLAVALSHKEADKTIFPKFLVPYSGESKLHAEAVKKLLLERLKTYAGHDVSLVWQMVRLDDPHSATAVTGDIRGVVAEMSRAKPDRIYFAFTGGTKTMSIAVEREIMKQVGKSIASAFLHPVSHKIEIDDPYGITLPEVNLDQRTYDGLRLTPEKIGELHGHELLKTADPSVALIAASRAFLGVSVQGAQQYRDWLNGFKASIGGSIDNAPAWSNERNWYKKLRYIRNPDRGVDAEGWIEFVHYDSPSWPSAVEALAKFWGPELWKQDSNGKWRINLNFDSKERLRPLYDYLDNKAIEYVLYDVIKSISPPESTIKHSAEFSAGDSKFELDVIVIYGYECVVFSCFFGDKRQKVKLKGFEARHRAEQLGGDHCRAVVVSLADYDTSASIEKDLADPIGLKKTPKLVTVLGANCFSDLLAPSPRNLAYAIWLIFRQLGWPVSTTAP